MASVSQIIRRRKARRTRRRAARARSRAWLGLGAGLFALLVILPGGGALAGAAWLYWSEATTLPIPQESFSPGADGGAARLMDRTGSTLLYLVQDPLGSSRDWVTLDSLPPYVAQATLIVEDPDFLESDRFDPFAAAAGLWNNALFGPLGQDPTLAGRLVRNLEGIPSTSATVEQRSREIALVAEASRLYSPEQLLEWHLNTNDYGSDAYGIDAAAQIYLGKRASQLTLAEAALLAAIPTAPQFNPLDNEVAARSRGDDVIRALLVAGHITLADSNEAATNSPVINPMLGQSPEIAPEFSLVARSQARDILQSLGLDGARLLARGGLTVTTTLDLPLYDQAECIMRAQLARLNGRTEQITTRTGAPCTAAASLSPFVEGGASPPDRGALALVEVQTGELHVMVGAAGNTMYQPGPVIYPFVYLQGFISGLYTPARMVLDIPRQFPGSVEGLIYTPNNPDGLFRGPMNLRDAMGAGYLPPAVQVANSQGIDNVLRVAHRMGINSLEEGGLYDLALLERGGVISVLDTAYAYSVFAGLGEMVGVPAQPIARGYRSRDPVAVLRITDSIGQVLWEYTPEQVALNRVPILEPGLAYLVNDVLADQETRWPLYGQNSVLDMPRPAAVVNGLTADRQDNWTAGYTPQYSAAVWLGRADRQPLTIDTYGLQGAAVVWRAVLENAHTTVGIPPTSWERPDKIVSVSVCQTSGLLPNSFCPVRSEIFMDGTQAALTVDSLWQSYEINSQTGQLATVNTPAGLRSERVFFVPPSDAADWWQANNQPLPPTEYDTVSRPELLGSAVILQPSAFDYVGGVVDVRGSLDPANMQFYTLSYGQGLNPTEWVQIGGQQTIFSRGSSLGLWDTNNLNGLYNLRLTVVLNDNTLDTSSPIQVTVDNQPPSIALTSVQPDYLLPRDTVVTLEAVVQDNLAIDRVEFYHGGEFLGTDTEWPYGLEWDIVREGDESFSAVAFDAVGNRSESPALAVTIRRSG